MKAKKLSKRIIAVVLTMMLVVGCFVVPTAFVGAAGETIVNIHYLRDDGAYDDWDVWAWADGLDGAGYSFTDGGDANGAVATVTLTESTPRMGFIVRKPDWSAKDPDGDRYVDLSSVISGTVDVYCVSGSGLDDFTVDYSNAVQGLKLKTAEATSHTEIAFTFTMDPGDRTITNEDFTIVSAGGQEIVISAVLVNGAEGVIRLADGEYLDYLKDYTITFGDASMKITLPDYFSSEEFESQYTYDGDDLGVTFTTVGKTNFRVWAPTAEKVELNIYAKGDGGSAEQVIEMSPDVKGTWVAVGGTGLEGKYYTYTAYFDGKVNADIVDPYARTVGVNGKRGMILNLDVTDPEGWDSDARHTYENPADMSIYELHIRDFSSDPDAQFVNPGKYAAFTETGVTTLNGAKAGIDYLKDLGITSVHILPSYDYGSVDETKLDKAQYNWGYDPVNYNSPEGSYSTDPYQGEIRVLEYKQMVKALHDAGIGVIMDVVYNHTYNTNYCFNQLVPGYFYRPGQNTSGCGNDVASERSMVSKFIVDSVKYWADEYHLDGFRFDLMGILDVNTMNNVRAACDELDKNIFIYGEGWNMGSKPTKDVKMANYTNSALTPRIAYFSDTIRDGIRGNVFEDTEKGYVGGGETAPKIRDGVAYTSSWAQSPVEVINYDSCHDNHTIWDRLQNTNPENTEEERISMNKLSAAIIFTSQGVPFMMSGEEFLRTKVKADGTLDHNSYASPDSVNSLYYDRAVEYSNVYEYYKGLIAMRKALPQFRLATPDSVNEKLTWAYASKGSLGYFLGDDTIVLYNPNGDWDVELPEGQWAVLANADKAGTKVLDTVEGTITVPAISAMVLVKGYVEPVDPTPVDPQPGDPENDKTYFNNVLPGVNAVYDEWLENSYLTVQEVDPKTVKVSDDKEVAKAYHFSMTVGGETFNLTDKPLHMSIANTDKDLKVVSVGKDGKVTELGFTYADGAYKFDVKTFDADYALVKAKTVTQTSQTSTTTTTGPTTTTVTDTVQTGDSTSILAVILIGVLSVAAMFAFVTYKRKKETEI